MYPSVEALSEMRYLNRASLSLRVQASVCAAAAERRKRSASHETRANDKLSLYGV